jgi:MFS family permease
MDLPVASRGISAHLRQRLALWVGGAAVLGGIIGFVSGRSFRGVVGGALLAAAAVLLVSWIDRLLDWTRRVFRVLRATFMGLGVGAALGVIFALVRKQGWLGPMLGGGVLGAIIGFFIALLIEHRRATPKPVPPGPPPSPLG